MRVSTFKNCQVDTEQNINITFIYKIPKSGWILDPLTQAVLFLLKNCRFQLKAAGDVDDSHLHHLFSQLHSLKNQFKDDENMKVYGQWDNSWYMMR